ncbi:Gmad2 immunoglobulin-like domain-containing protein [Actinotalea sp.]|uniref:Gmad2 immunoglobulin-like domain-containing protein n=1 Tax=Actinotalea sp. TaxID=1872145 RepID=UPI00356A0C9B
MTRRSLAAAGALLLVTLTGCTTTAPEPGGTTSASSPTTSPSDSPSPTASSTAAEILVPVYYATDTGTDLRLVREFRRLPDEGGAALTAARAVLAGAPLDPDYSGLWAPEGQVLAVDALDGVIEVDLTEAATRTTTGSAGANLAVQALVYAVTGALASDDPVRLLVEGEPVDELFGVLDTRAPIAREDPLSTRLLVQINDPNEGDVLDGEVTVTGEAAVYEATLPWEVRTSDGAVVQSGVTMTAEGQTFAPFSLTLTLEPGEYVVVITEDDPSGGEGRPPTSDSRAFSVR